MEDPRQVYEERRRERLAELRRWSRYELTVSISRLVVAVAAIVVAWLSIQSRWFSAWWCVPLVVVFGVLLVVHERVLRRRGRYSRAVELYARGLRRLDGDWIGVGDAGERYASEEAAGGGHLYSSDLDLFGKGSLFELLCEARTRSGADTLARWLEGAAALEEVRLRQGAVADLAPRLDLREDLSTLGQELQSELESEALARWAQGSPRLGGLRLLRPILALLSVANVAGIFGWWLWGWGPAPLLITVMLDVLVLLLVRGRVEESIRGVDRASADLSLIAELLLRIEREPFEAPWLRQRVDELRVEGQSPGREIARLQRLVDLLESRRNAFFAPFAALLWWTTQLAFAVEDWRGHSGSMVERWLQVVGEIEAAGSLAVFHYERADHPFPELVESAPGASPPEAPVLEGTALGHPLIPAERRVCNDVELDATRRALIVSGSNMSGKSTYLRTCGVNVVLALAGAPVCAGSLRLTPLAVGASIRIQDSLMEGASKFYAEITRLRHILDLTAGELPVLFLLDEILHGTNSHDRRIGAEAVVRALIERGAIGLVTTHDLALARIAEAPGSLLANVHFEDTLEGGKVCFDYRLREGVVKRSNALALMREVGLDV
ncbi:MAG TPA: DNA mismatch repair protein MutS [Thermoanaerobaculia bacterium]|nr:DNA mismatch repair protein MutS [Thermoanaerobaculia bacterium]